MRTQGRQDGVREELSLGKVGGDLKRAEASKRSPSEQSLSKRCTVAENHDPLYLFACHLHWKYRRDLAAYQGLVSALDDSDNRIREIAEMLVHRTSPRPPRESRASIMEWFHSTEREQEPPSVGLASSSEIQSAFDEQRDYLYWIALLITGDKVLADLAVVNASSLSSNYSSVFRDWLNGWAKYATVRAAVREVHDLISASATYFAELPSDESVDDVLSDNQTASLRLVDPREVIAALDSLPRAALVLRGIQHASIADCALLLDMPRRIVAAAYCHALRWNSKRTDAHCVRNEDRADSRI